MKIYAGKIMGMNIEIWYRD